MDTEEKTESVLLPETVPDIFMDAQTQQYSSRLSPSLDGHQNDNRLKLNEGNNLHFKANPDKLLHHCLPVTCLKLLDGIVLVASEGPSIQIKMVHINDQPFQRFQIFPSQFVISGMEFMSSPILECGDCHEITDKAYEHNNLYVGFIWAGSLGTLVRVTRSVKDGIKLLEYSNGDLRNTHLNLDFIPVSAKWLEGGNVLALLSVLNYVVLLERAEKNDSPDNFTNLRELRRIKCDKSETLFSGSISGNSRSNIKIFAGTVFNGIVVWNITEDQHTIEHELKCHDGIIFSLEYYTNRGILISTSDDRTVAVWKFSKGEEEERVKLLHRFYGHDARVWKALSVHGYILSVGEDSEVRVNILENGSDHKTWRAHDGAPIFTCVYDEDMKILYTGGNDGAIRKWPKWWYQLRPRILPFDVIPFDPEKDEQSRIQGSGRWAENKDYPKAVLLLDINHVLVSMDSGRVLGLNWEGKQYDLLNDARCKGYQIIRASPDHKILAVAGDNGHFYLARISFSENQSSKRIILHAKQIFMTRISWNIITMIWLDVSRLLIICLNRAIAILLEESKTVQESELEVQFIQTFNLNLKKPGVPVAVEVLGKYVILGDEIGSLHVFRYQKTDQAIRTFENVHKDGCTSLLYHDTKLYSSGRDGKVRCFDIRIDAENDLKIDFVPLCSFSMPFEWTAGIYLNMDQMLCCGFQKEDFIVYSINEKRTLLKIPCGGGGNRKWDFIYGHGIDGSRNAAFSFVKDKEVFYTFLPMEGYIKNTLKQGLHSRIVNCALQLLTKENKIDYISGSEDGSLKWFQWDTVNQSILSIETMENHVSSVRSAWKITTVSNQTYLFTGGGRSQLCIYKIDFINQRLEVLKEIVLVKTTFKQTEGDVRIMDIVGVERENHELWCFSACSDGICRVVYFNTKTNKFKIAGLLNGNAHAVMRIHLINTGFSKDEVLIVGVTSNGYLIIWTWNDSNAEAFSLSDSKHNILEKMPEFTLLLRKTAFLSMRASLSSKQMYEETHRIVFGGDDCSVSLWTLVISKESENLRFSINENWTKDHCQRGAVVEIEIENNCIYSLSNDQIFGQWDLNGKLIMKVFAGVSDCQGFVKEDLNRCIMCYGKGISWIPIIENSL